MEIYHRLLNLQNQSWFFKYKDFFCQKLTAKHTVSEVFDMALEEFPELGDRLVSPVLSPVPLISFRWLIYGQADFPDSFYQMVDPPLILTVIGHDCWKLPTLSVVGSREPLSESLAWIDEVLGSFAELHRPVLVSGGARGIDQAVHALAIKKKLPTIVFLPSGLEEIYPKNLREWIPRIVENGGCLISEYPLTKPTEKSLFHHRNRLIAQMGIATVIVQAAAKSGTLMTGHLAAEAGKPTWVVPSHPLRQVFQGNLNLLREGATMICSAEDLSLFFRAEVATLQEGSAYLGSQDITLD